MDGHTHFTFDPPPDFVCHYFSLCVRTPSHKYANPYSIIVYLAASYFYYVPTSVYVCRLTSFILCHISFEDFMDCNFKTFDLPNFAAVDWLGTNSYQILLYAHNAIRRNIKNFRIFPYFSKY